MADRPANSNDLANCHPKPFPRSSVSGAQAYLLWISVLMVFAVSAAYFVSRF